MEDLIGFYTAGFDEAGRLARPSSRLELLRTRELLGGRLPPPPASVLDVGGGTGVHAAWLAADGYDVTLIDIVPEHVRAAQAAGLSARVGDARALEAPDGAADACLLLGPLYHLPDRSDRLAALREAARVTRPGGLVCAAAISRFAFALYALRDRRAISEEAIAETIATGRGDPVGELPDAYSHRPDELAGELSSAGLAEVEVLGIEGPGWPQFTRGVTDVAALLDAALKTARLCDGQPEMTAASAHLLACGRRRG